jgi:site-specific DNA recombinase
VLHRLSSTAMAKALVAKPKRKPVALDLAQIERDLEGLAEDFGTGRISRREWLAARKPLEERQSRARATVDAANGTAALTVFRSGNDPRVVWDKLDVDRKRIVLDTLIDRIIVNPATKPGRFENDRIDVVWRV